MRSKRFNVGRLPELVIEIALALLTENLLADFILASREAQFLFGPNSDVYDKLTQLNEASFTIINTPKLQKELQDNDKFTNAMKLWRESIEPLEGLMAPYLNYHYALSPVDFVVTLLVERMRRWRSISRKR